MLYIFLVAMVLIMIGELADKSQQGIVGGFQLHGDFGGAAVDGGFRADGGDANGQTEHADTGAAGEGTHLFDGPAIRESFAAAETLWFAGERHKGFGHIDGHDGGRDADAF